jgi:thioesterase domain-containing protein/acyl carrier protein
MRAAQDIGTLSRQAVEKSLAEIWCRALEVEKVGLQDDFFQLGGDSLAAAQVLVEIQRTFGRRLPLTVFNEAPSLQAQVKIIARRTGLAPWPMVVALQPQGSNAPFFCVHGAGGSTLSFAELARRFAPHQPFYGIRASDADGYRQRFHRIEDMACHYLEAVRAIQPLGPYYLGGYSFGGSVALEMAQQLHAEGERVALLAILDHTPPPTRYRTAVWSRTLIVDFAVNLVRWIVEDLWRAGRGQRLATLCLKARRALGSIRTMLQGSGVATGKGDMEAIFAGRAFPEPFQQLLVTHYQAMRDYVPRPYPGRVTLFRARARPLFRLHGRDLGWTKLAGGGLEILAVPGNHETMLKPPHVTALAEALLSRLKDAHARSGVNGPSTSLNESCMETMEDISVRPDQTMMIPPAKKVP